MGITLISVITGPIQIKNLVNDNISDFKFVKENMKQVMNTLNIIVINYNKRKMVNRVKIYILLFIIFIVKIGN